MKCLKATYTTGKYFTVTKSSVRTQTCRMKPSKSSTQQLSLIVLPRHRPSTRDKSLSSSTELLFTSKHQFLFAPDVRCDSSFIVHLTEHLSDQTQTKGQKNTENTK